MEKRHLFERELQLEALQEFDALARIKELVDTGRHFARAWNRSLALAVQAGAVADVHPGMCW